MAKVISGNETNEQPGAFRLTGQPGFFPSLKSFRMEEVYETIGKTRRSRGRRKA
jgi:hypothetical protein